MLKALLNRIRSLWQRGCLGKFVVGCGSVGFLMACCALTSVIIPTTPTLTPTITSTMTPVFTATVTATKTPTATETPVPSPTPIAECLPANTPGEIATVTKIVDGDTIEVLIEDKVYRVRYIGIDTPERDEYFYREATEANRQLTEGKQVLLIKDVSETDKYQRLLRYVIADGVFVNYELVRRGYAQAFTYPPDVACSDFFLAAQREARADMVGLWKPQATRGFVLDIQKPSGNCDPSYPDVCIAPPPPDLDCSQISYRRFRVLPPDPHNFDGDRDGIGCEK